MALAAGLDEVADEEVEDETLTTGHTRPNVKAAKARAAKASQERVMTDDMGASRYGGGPGAGITLPPYLKPTPSCTNGTTYFPTAEKLGKDEMRISFLGTCPFPPKRNQAATCIMVELGNGDRFFFDFGPGCLRNVIAMQVPLQVVNDIFLTHLHVDHYGELPYLFAFAPWVGRWKPLRVHGPTGRTPEFGTKAMIKGMKEMTKWHWTAFGICPVGDGYEVDVNEFPWDDDGGICYQKNGVTVRHWRRSHNMDGSSAYRLDWNGLSFVWTGDGRPDDLTAELSKGVDVFVTELQMDTARVQNLKTGLPEAIYNLTIDTVHTDHYATGHMINRVNPRIGMVTHMAYDHDLLAEALAGVRVHWNGLFALGAPDGVVVNVTKDEVWVREAALPESANARRPSTVEEMEQWLGKPIPDVLTVPHPVSTIVDLVDPVTRSYEIDPRRITPPDVQRPLVKEFPKELAGKKIPIGLMFGARQAKGAAAKVKEGMRTLKDSAGAVAKGVTGQMLPDVASAEVSASIDAILAKMDAASEPVDMLQAGGEMKMQALLKTLLGQRDAGSAQGPQLARQLLKTLQEIAGGQLARGPAEALRSAVGPLGANRLRETLESSLETAFETLRSATGAGEIAQAKGMVSQIVGMLGQLPPSADPSTQSAVVNAVPVFEDVVHALETARTPADIARASGLLNQLLSTAGHVPGSAAGRLAGVLRG